MWMKAQSEVVRQRNLLRQQQITGDALLEKFRTASREEVRLAAALQGFFTQEGGEDYLAYLRRRPQPAALALLEENQILELERLEQAVGLRYAQVEDLLERAIAMGRPEATVWLLRRKEEYYGFRDRDFSL